MGNLSYVIALLLFAVMLWIGFNKRENAQEIDEQANQTLIEEKNARVDVEVQIESSTETEEE